MQPRSQGNTRGRLHGRTRARGSDSSLNIPHNRSNDTMKTTLQRFTEKVNKTDNCWEWTAYINRHGYGAIRFNGRATLAHRVSYELHNGPIPEGFLVCHHCDNPKCVNPGHLFIGTHQDNRNDCLKKGRFANGNTVKTHCKHGHAFSLENTYTYSNGHRMCRTCARKLMADEYIRRKAARAILEVTPV